MSVLPFLPTCDAGVVPPTPTPGLIITIAGTDRSSYYKSRSLSITETLGSRSTCGFQIFDSTGALSCPVGSEVIVKIDGETVFSGTIEKTDKRFPSMDYSDTNMYMAIRCVDWNQVLDRKLVSRVYRAENQSFGTIVRELIREFLADEGIVAGQIMNGSETDYISFQFETVTACLQQLADAVGYVFYVDYNKQLHFRDRIDVAAPFDLTASSTNFRNITVSESRTRYRNIQYLRGGLEASPLRRIETFGGNNSDRTFTLSHPVGEEPEIWVKRGAPVGLGGVDGDRVPPEDRPDIWALEEVPGGGGRLGLALEAARNAGQWDNDVYYADFVELTVPGSPWELQSVGTGAAGDIMQWSWEFGDKEVTQNSDEVALRAYAYYLLTDAEIKDGFEPLLESIISDSVRIVYKPLIRIVARSEDDAEITARQLVEGGTGVYEAVEEDERITDSSFAQTKVEGLLNQLSRIPKTANIETDQAGIRAGQLQTLTLTKLGLSGSFLIQSFSATDRGDETLRYSYKALDGESLGGWQEFFRRLIDRGRKFVVSEGETVMVFGESEEAVTLTDNLPTPDTSNTLGAYTTDAYTVCLISAGSAVGKSFPSLRTYADIIRDSYPLLYYRLDAVGTFSGAAPITDSSGNFNGGSGYFLGVTSPGAVGTASTPGTLNPTFCAVFPISIPAADFFGRITAPASALKGQGDLTFGFWLAVPQRSDEMTIFNGGTAADLSNIRLAIDANASPTSLGTDSVSLHYYDTAAAATRTVTWTGLELRNATNTFSHFALVRDQRNQTVELYINAVSHGVKVTNTAGGSIAMTSLDVDTFIIGQSFDSSLIAYDEDKEYVGLLDEFAIFPSALPQATIADHAKDRQTMYHVGSRIPTTDEPTYMAL
jgi:hypothetical protein|tara:strand:+ start:7930 stop:10578 length:2649 start_codon:yes stop_codon:yes gene_type:complete